jgi:TolA-binding protein
MSDDLRKRQRIEDREVMRVVDNQENSRSRQGYLEHEIRSLRQEIDSLSSENKSLSSYISRFSLSLATVSLI